jgi:uncharacterized YigZ family protein
MEDYFIITSEGNAEYKEKSSRFMGFSFSVHSIEEAKTKLDEIKHVHHTASHVPYAYRIRFNEFHYSDDGEPSGTAGKPIMEIIEQNKLLNTLILVVRYFGGIKLGPGGLRRAFKTCAEMTIDASNIELIIPTIKVRLEFNYGLIGKIKHLMALHTDDLGANQWNENQVEMIFKVPNKNWENCQNELTSLNVKYAIIDNAED